jgi:flagellar biosynthesis GTPase FlhF
VPTIEVTAEDIAKAHVNDSYRCVVAQAIARQIPDAHRIEVDIQTIRWSDKTGRHVYLTPYAAAGYVVAYDAGEEMHPFRFMLKNPVPTVQRRANTEAARTARKTRTKVSREKKRKKDAEAILSDPAAPPERVAAAQVRVEEAPQRIETATAAHEDLKAAYRAAGESMSEQRVSEATRPAPPKVFKKKRREYGARTLRVNQAEGRKHYAN